MAKPIIGYRFAVVIFVFSVFHVGGENCPPENCLAPDKCEEPVKGQTFCPSNNDIICCSVVKGEFRTMCRHHGGECMDSCASVLTRTTVDCEGGTVCCVLV